MAGLLGLVAAVGLVVSLVLMWIVRENIRQSAAERQHRAMMLQEMKEMKRCLQEIQKARQDMAWLSPEIARLEREIRSAQRGK